MRLLTYVTLHAWVYTHGQSTKYDGESIVKIEFILVSMVYGAKIGGQFSGIATIQDDDAFAESLGPCIGECGGRGDAGKPIIWECLLPRSEGVIVILRPLAAAA